METTQPRFNYTQHAWEGTKYRKNENLYGSDLSKAIRQELKDSLPTCKFSVTSETYSGGQSISINLMSANFNPFNELTEEIKEKIKHNALRSFPNCADQVFEQALLNFKEETIDKKTHSLNQYYIKDDLSLTDEAKEIIIKALGIAQSYNFDDSNSQVDYFHTNFYLHAGIGKWDKPFILKK